MVTTEQKLGREHKAYVWQCPCGHFNHLWTTRITNPNSSRVGVDCKKCGKRIQIFYRSKYGSEYWLVKHLLPSINLRSVARDMADNLNDDEERLPWE